MSSRVRLIAIPGLVVIAATVLVASPFAGSTVLSVSPNPAPLVAGDDITLSATTTSAAGNAVIDAGRIQFSIATDGVGHLVSKDEAGVVWVNLQGGGVHPSGGLTALSLDLDDLSSLGLGLENATCGDLIGFRAHYVTGGGSQHVSNHASNAVNLEVCHGPVSPLYLTAGDSCVNWLVQGTTATPYAQEHCPPNHQGEYAIAVLNSVRTLGFQGLGSEYDLAFTYGGVDYPYPFSPPSTRAFKDGSTDGTYNYALDYYTGDVYRTDLDWTNPELLFSTSASPSTGITFDSTNSSLWVSNAGTNTISNYTLGGTFISSFTGPGASGFNKFWGFLAFDPADSTLWLWAREVTDGTTTLYQFSRTGIPLSAVTYPAMHGYFLFGGEFQEPGAQPRPRAHLRPTPRHR